MSLERPYAEQPPDLSALLYMCCATICSISLSFYSVLQSSSESVVRRNNQEARRHVGGLALDRGFSGRTAINSYPYLHIEIAFDYTHEAGGVKTLAAKVIIVIAARHLNSEGASLTPDLTVFILVHWVVPALYERLRDRSCRYGTSQQKRAQHTKKAIHCIHLPAQMS